MTQETVTHFVVGTYADGTVRSHHFTSSTITIEERMADLLKGFLPFEKVEAVVCEDNWNCTHTRDLRLSLTAS